MILEDIKLGEVYRIVGNKGGCCNEKCIDCEFFSSHLIKAISIMNEKIHAVHMITQTTEGEGGVKCEFLPEDLEQLKITNWRSMIE